MPQHFFLQGKRSPQKGIWHSHLSCTGLQPIQKANNADKFGTWKLGGAVQSNPRAQPSSDCRLSFNYLDRKLETMQRRYFYSFCYCVCFQKREPSHEKMQPKIKTIVQSVIRAVYIVVVSVVVVLF